MIDGRGWGSRILRIYLPVLVCLVVMLFPFYWMLITSIKPNRELYNAKIMRWCLTAHAQPTTPARRHELPAGPKTLL